MDKDKYLTTGEFAKVMNVTKNTLFHYDKIGLLSPEVKLHNDYRYYSFKQIETMDVILILKEFGMPLQEIKRYLNECNSEGLLNLLEKEENLIEKKIKELENKKTWITERREELKNFGKIDINKIYIKNESERYYLLKSSERSDNFSIAKITGDLIEQYNNALLTNTYKIIWLQYEENIKKDIHNNYHDVILLMNKKPKGIKYSILEKGRYIKAYHKGKWEDIGETYAKIKEYIKIKNLKVDNLYLESSIVDRLITNDYKDYITEINVRIIE